jgi:hypothetical protein
MHDIMFLMHYKIVARYLVLIDENGFSQLHEENSLMIAIGLWWERKEKEKKVELKGRDGRNWGNWGTHP